MFNKTADTLSIKPSNNNINQDSLIGTSQKNIGSMNLKEQNYKALNFQGAFHELIRQPAVNFFCTVHGLPCEGKSTFCIHFANYPAKNFGSVVTKKQIKHKI